MLLEGVKGEMRRLKQVLEKITPLDEKVMEEVQRRLDSLTKPQGSLGRLEKIVKQIAGIRRNSQPEVEGKVIVVMSADHGVTDEGVSAYPKEVTYQMVENFIAGGAGINVLARQVGAELILVDMGVEGKIKNKKVKIKNGTFVERKVGLGTKDMVKGPAMSREEAVRSIETGIEVVEERLAKEGRVDLLGTGDMGIGNTTPSSAIAAVMTGFPVRKVTGRGTGIDGQTFDHKVDVIEQALLRNKPNPDDPIDVLAKVGGFEIGGLCGVILAGAAARVPVVVDGFISGAASLIATGLNPLVKDYLVASHLSQEIGHTVMLQQMNLEPVLDLNLRLGEGTGAALAMMIVEASCRILKEMATFGEAGVSRKED